MNEQKNNGAKNTPKNQPIGTDEKAQYEVFRNGNLPRETIREWIGNDLKSIQSFVHGCLNDPDIFDAIVDAYYKRYSQLHEQKNVESNPTQAGN